MARSSSAALAATFATSLVGAATYALLSLVSPGDVAPDWWLGLACGTGGLIGGYLGALATALGTLYAAQTLT